MSKSRVKRCFACGVIIGPGYVEEKPFYLGRKILCHIHFMEIKRTNKLLLQEFPSIRSNRVLLPNGHVEFVPRLQ